MNHRINEPAFEYTTHVDTLESNGRIVCKITDVLLENIPNHGIFFLRPIGIVECLISDTKELMNHVQ